MISEDRPESATGREQRDQLHEMAICTLDSLGDLHREFETRILKLTGECVRVFWIKRKLDEHATRPHQRRNSVFRPGRSQNLDMGYLEQSTDRRRPPRCVRSAQVIAGDNERRCLGGPLQPNEAEKRFDVLFDESQDSNDASPS